MKGELEQMKAVLELFSIVNATLPHLGTLPKITDEAYVINQ